MRLVQYSLACFLSAKEPIELSPIVWAHFKRSICQQLKIQEAFITAFTTGIHFEFAKSLFGFIVRKNTSCPKV
jgi:uncharacterized BrkB/YihY/UPF0761 family membrane protein